MELTFLDSIEPNNFVLYVSIAFVFVTISILIYTFVKQRRKFITALIIAVIANVSMFTINVPNMKEERDDKIHHKKIDELIGSISDKHGISIKEKDAEEIIDKYENGSSISFTKIRARKVGTDEIHDYCYNVEDSEFHIYEDCGDRDLID